MYAAARRCYRRYLKAHIGMDRHANGARPHF